jgi:hypothetical protein
MLEKATLLVGVTGRIEPWLPYGKTSSFPFTRLLVSEEVSYGASMRSQVWAQPYWEKCLWLPTPCLGSHPRQQFHMVGCFYKIFIFQLHAHCNKSKQHKTGSSRQRKVSPLSVGEIFPILLMHRVSLKGKLAAPFWSPHPWGYNLLPPACFLICKTG